MGARGEPCNDDSVGDLGRSSMTVKTGADFENRGGRRVAGRIQYPALQPEETDLCLYSRIQCDAYPASVVE
jgi:hypothetical protein